MELVRETQWTKRHQRRKNMQHTHFCPSLLPSLPFHDRGPALALPRVCSMKAYFLPFSTIGPFSADCFYSDRGVLPLSCADNPAKSCCGLLVQRGQINNGSKKKPHRQTDTKLSKMCKRSFYKVQRKCSISPNAAPELWTETQSQ